MVENKNRMNYPYSNHYRSGYSYPESYGNGSRPYKDNSVPAYPPYAGYYNARDGANTGFRYPVDQYGDYGQGRDNDRYYNSYPSSSSANHAYDYAASSNGYGRSSSDYFYDYHGSSSSYYASRPPSYFTRYSSPPPHTTHSSDKAFLSPQSIPSNSNNASSSWSLASPTKSRQYTWGSRKIVKAPKKVLPSGGKQLTASTSSHSAATSATTTSNASSDKLSEEKEAEVEPVIQDAGLKRKVDLSVSILEHRIALALIELGLPPLPAVITPPKIPTPQPSVSASSASVPSLSVPSNQTPSTSHSTHSTPTPSRTHTTSTPIANAHTSNPAPVLSRPPLLSPPPPQLHDPSQHRTPVPPTLTHTPNTHTPSNSSITSSQNPPTLSCPTPIASHSSLPPLKRSLSGGYEPTPKRSHTHPQAYPSTTTNPYHTQQSPPPTLERHMTAPLPYKTHTDSHFSHAQPYYDYDNYYRGAGSANSGYYSGDAAYYADGRDGYSAGGYAYSGEYYGHRDGQYPHSQGEYSARNEEYRGGGGRGAPRRDSTFFPRNKR